jgi:hypothetical protein
VSVLFAVKLKQGDLIGRIFAITLGNFVSKCHKYAALDF